MSPALNLKTIEYCNREGVAVFPGALTPTEILTAWQAGADVVKKVSGERGWRSEVFEGNQGSAAAD